MSDILRIPGAPQNLKYQDGVAISVERIDNQGANLVSELHGFMSEQAFRGNLAMAANQSAQALSVALTTTYTGLVVSNPIASGVYAAIRLVGFALSVGPAGIASIHLGGGYSSAGIVTHTTPLTPFWTDLASSGTPKCLADSAATLVGTPKYLFPLMGGFTAATLPSSPPMPFDFQGAIIVRPGAYVMIVGLTAATGFGAISWEEIPL